MKILHERNSDFNAGLQARVNAEITGSDLHASIILQN